MKTTKLGTPPIKLAHRFETPALFIESSPGSGHFSLAPYLDAFTVRRGSNANLDSAEIRVLLADNPEVYNNPSNKLIDWQVRTLDLNARNIYEIASRRRIAIRSTTQWSTDDWVIFYGYVERITLGWTGNGDPKRWATLQCISAIAAMDREFGQLHAGQWRRHTAAEYDYIRSRDDSGHQGDSDLQRTCCKCQVPLIFNPDGRPNCDPRPLTFDDDGGTSNVYVPTDVENKEAIPWTVAKMLRYVEWAAFQGENPTQFDLVRHKSRYDQLNESIPDAGVRGRNKDLGWTSQSIRFDNLDALIEWRPRDDGSKPLVDRAPSKGESHVVPRTLLRAIPNVAIDTFSTLEAIVHICDRANITVSYDYAANDNGGITPSIRFSVRGDRHAETPGTKSPFLKGTTSGVYLYVASDVDDSLLTERQQLEATNAVNGQVSFDTSTYRTQVFVPGDPTQYELTVELRPGWKPDSWWDIDPSNQNAVNEAVGRIGQIEWLKRYAPLVDTPDAISLYRKVGRNWVLNEDGAYTKKLYGRQFGPFRGENDDGSDAEFWQPFRFWRNGVSIFELEFRNDRGWTTRRRRFLPTIAIDHIGSVVLDAQPSFGVFTQWSVDGGSTWIRGQLEIEVADDRCAIFIRNHDIHAIVDPTTGVSFVEAYIRGKLRIRVTANVEGDDCVYGYAQSSSVRQLGGVRWCHFIDRRGEFKRILRGRRGGPPDELEYGGRSQFVETYNILFPAIISDQDEADWLAERLLDEAELRRTTGDVTIPYLLRPSKTQSYASYQVGDEILGIRTEGSSNYVDFIGSTREEGFYPRVVAIDYSYSGANAGDNSTTLHLESAPTADAEALSAQMADQRDPLAAIQRRLQREIDARAI